MKRDHTVILKIYDKLENLTYSHDCNSVHEALITAIEYKMRYGDSMQIVSHEIK